MLRQLLQSKQENPVSLSPHRYISSMLNVNVGDAAALYSSSGLRGLSSKHVHEDGQPGVLAG